MEDLAKHLPEETNQQVNEQFTEEEVLKLYQRFRSFDDSGDGRIGLNHILKLEPSLTDNPLMSRVLSVFDKGGDGKVSFLEFVSGLARVAHDESSKQKFLFEVYDLNKDGYVSNGDLFRVVRMMSGDNLSPVQLQQLVDRTIRDWDKDMDGRLNFDEFKAAMSHVSLRSQLELDL